MHHRDQQVVRKIAVQLLCLYAEPLRDRERALQAFQTARAAVEERVGTKMSDADFDKMFEKWATPK